MHLLKLVLTAVLLGLSGCASVAGSNQSNELERLQYAWSAAIRWSDFQGAINLIEPEQRAAQPLTAVELERYRQVQVAAYRDVGASSNFAQGTAVRDIEMSVINRHTQAERGVRYREQWRWDPAAKTWWLVSGLPDLDAR